MACKNLKNGLLFILYLCVVLLFKAAYWNIGKKALSGWTNSQKVFAIVTLGISSCMAYSKREQLNRAHHDPSLLIGTILLISD